MKSNNSKVFFQLTEKKIFGKKYFCDFFFQDFSKIDIPTSYLKIKQFKLFDTNKIKIHQFSTEMPSQVACALFCSFRNFK